MIFIVPSALIFTVADNLFASFTYISYRGTLYNVTAQDSWKTRRSLLYCLFSELRKNVKNGPLLSPRGRLRSISVETGRITNIDDYKWIEKLHYYLTAAASTSVTSESHQSISVQTLSTSIHVTDDANICIFPHNVRKKSLRCIVVYKFKPKWFSESQHVQKYQGLPTDDRK